MLLCREFFIGALRKLKPTYDDLSVLSEYVILFEEEIEKIVEIIRIESRESSAYTNLFILYLINELMSKGCGEESVVKVGKEVMKEGKEKTEELKRNSTQKIKTSAEELLQKYEEIEKLWKASSAKKEVKLPLDIEYLESLCKKKDKEKIMKYINEVKE